ncbi:MULTISPECIES: hypothetical protein [unclassified Sedimentibacter]|uniref:hypothetical protein n=1 Tax=unclassified Sedimentibacter TaxID=2649220 RepID=UPI0027DF9A59|nr:hypothetical protein [Sedimentibacter sp. MB35-C1]WMJ77582.1 hypothetical protein RBQ61_01240 [Sedimentibacter sp. MB35-C1]
MGSLFGKNNVNSRIKNSLKYRNLPPVVTITVSIIVVILAVILVANSVSKRDELIRYVNNYETYPEFIEIIDGEDIARINEIMGNVRWTKEIAIPADEGDISFWTEREGFKERFFDYDIWFNVQTIVWDPSTNKYGLIENAEDIDYLKYIFSHYSATDINYSLKMDIYTFFDTLISPETYKIDMFNDPEKVYAIFGKYCNERGLNVLLKNRVAFKNRKVFEENNITDYFNLRVELIGEEADANLLFQKYRVSYEYQDDNFDLHEFNDYYIINIKDNKIDYIKLDLNAGETR